MFNFSKNIHIAHGHLSVVALALVALSACVQQTTAGPNVPVGLDYSRSWIGNSYGTAGQKGGKWVQNNIVALWVAPDGHCYTASSWDEGKREGGIYQNGDVVGNLDNLHPDEGGAWGMGVSAITGDATSVYVGVGSNVRRYKMDGDHSPFEGGVGKWKDEVQVTAGGGYIWALSADAKNDRLYVAFRGDGAREAKDKKPATEKVPDEIIVLSLKDMKPLARWNVERAGRLAAAPDGTVWVTQEADSQNNVTAKILHFGADGAKLPQEIGGTNWSPTALHFDGAGRLMVADNGPDQQIKIYDVTNVPKASGTFGQKGGVFSGVAGEIKPLKFIGLTGVGTDAAGNVYVSQNRFGPHVNGSEGAGANLESYNPKGTRNWQVLGLEFVDGGDFVPGTDGAQAYSKYTRYNLDLSKTTPGSEWNYAAHTLNHFKYPNDPRFLHIRDHFDFSTTAFVRVLAGRRFVFNNSMWGSRLEIYRFNAQTDGEIAIPSGMLRSGGGELPGAPKKGEWLWRDLNGNGNPESDEFSQPEDSKDLYVRGWWVDERGDLWQASVSPNQIRRFPFAGLDEKGNPKWDYATMQSVEAPAPFIGKGSAPFRAEYFPETDTLYMAGYSTDVPIHDGHNLKLIGTAMACYPNWSKGNRTAKWVNTLFDASGRANRFPTSMRVAGEFVFIGYDGGPYSPDSGFLRVFRASDGGYVGRLWAGTNASGRIDVAYGVSAMKRKNGEYLVLAEEDWYARQMLYRWTPTTQKPLAPVVTAKAGNTLTQLSWAASPGTGHFSIERAEKSEGPFTVVDPASEETSFLDTNLPNGVARFYRVTAAGNAGAAVSKTFSVTPTAQTAIRINAGGAQSGQWVGDLYNDGKYQESTGSTVDVSAPNAAPMAVYQSNRVGSFTFRIPGQTVGQKYLVRLHFSEWNGGLVAWRKQNVEINGVKVLENFNVGGAAGGKANVAVVKDFPDITPDEKGEIVLKFTGVANFDPILNGLEIIPQ